MGTGEVGSPKWVAKRMKMKGLQKLRWYCQACEKQCRDEHGFKLHTSSPSHLARIKTAQGRKQEYSNQFESQFKKLLTNHHSRPVSANKLYNELVQDKQHIRMNSTRFSSLTAFMKYLESNGVIKICAWEPEMLIQYIDKEAHFWQEKQKQMQMQRTIEQDRAEKKVLEAAIENEKAEARAIEKSTPNNADPENYKRFDLSKFGSAASTSSTPGARTKISFNLKKR